MADEKQGELFATDSFVNLLSGMGTEKDKGVFTQYVFTQLSKPQLEAAYRGDWIARKVVDIPAFDSTRKWRAWQGADGDQIDQLEDFEREYFLQQKLLTALTRARLYGGAALVLGVDQGNPEDELIIDKVGKDQLKFVHAVGRWELATGPRILDIMSPYYGEPEWYERRNYGSGAASLRLHPSRVVRLLGNDVPDPFISQDTWGDSVLQSVDDAIRSAGVVAGGIAAMVQEAKVDVIKIPGLTKNIQTKQYQDRLSTRFTYANTAKSIINTLVLDKDEDWERIQTQFGSLPDVLHTYLIVVSGAADIPATRMLGQSPKGMNATGEADIRNYYDRIAAEQVTRLTPALSRLDEVIIRSVFGTRDPSIYYNWNSLWQMDDTQRAAINKSKADAFKIDADLGLINTDALRQARIDQLIEDGVYPGFEQIIADNNNGEPDLAQLPGGMLDPTLADPNNPAGDPALIARQKQLLLAPPPKKPPVAGLKKLKLPDGTMMDAEPRSLYMRRDVLNKAEIERWARAQGFKSVLPDMHVTIVYSKTPIDWMKAAQSGWSGDKNGELFVPPGGARLMEEFDGGAIVLLFGSSELCWRHEDIIRAGASSDYSEYQPHITITYDPGDVNIDTIEPYRGKIVLGPEIFEEVVQGGFEPSTVVERTLDAVVPGFDAEAFQKQMMDKLDGLRQQPPVVHVHLPKAGKVRKDVTHDELGRAVSILETPEEDVA